MIQMNTMLLIIFWQVYDYGPRDLSYKRVHMLCELKSLSLSSRSRCIRKATIE